MELIFEGFPPRAFEGTLESVVKTVFQRRKTVLIFEWTSLELTQRSAFDESVCFDMF